MRIRSFYFRMVVFCLMATGTSLYFFSPIATVFAQNQLLNSLILSLGIFGIALSFTHIRTFAPELAWLEGLTHTDDKSASPLRPTLLKPLRDLLAAEDVNITRAALGAVSDAVESALVSQREIARYLAGSAIFLGLLGTFWGLSMTLQSVSHVIATMPTDAGVAHDFLSSLKSGLQSPLSGMGIAFSSSLFGLIVSLILGFLELNVNQARTNFLEHVSRWMHTNCTPIEESLLQKPVESPQLLRALLTMTAENLETMRQTMSEQQSIHQALAQSVERLNEGLARVVDQRYAEHDVLLKVAESTLALQDSTTEFREAIRTHNFGVDNATAAHIRSLEQSARNLVETTARGNATLTHELRNEIRLLSRTLASIAGEEMAELSPQSSPNPHQKNQASQQHKQSA